MPWRDSASLGNFERQTNVRCIGTYERRPTSTVVIWRRRQYSVPAPTATAAIPTANDAPLDPHVTLHTSSCGSKQMPPKCAKNTTYAPPTVLSQNPAKPKRRSQSRGDAANEPEMTNAGSVGTVTSLSVRCARLPVTSRARSHLDHPISLAAALALKGGYRRPRARASPKCRSGTRTDSRRPPFTHRSA